MFNSRNAGSKFAAARKREFDVLKKFNHENVIRLFRTEQEVSLFLRRVRLLHKQLKAFLNDISLLNIATDAPVKIVRRCQMTKKRRSYSKSS